MSTNNVNDQINIVGLGEVVTLTKFQERANVLIALGVPIIPLLPNSKAPCTPHAALDASTDPTQISKWAKQFPECNIAAVARYDRFWFQDDDAGTLSATYKADTGQDFPCTFTVKTSRGYHYYFLHDEASRLVRYDGHENSGVICIPGYRGEARCNNQYVVGPLSVHPSGTIYEVFNDAPIVAAPVQLLEWLQKAFALSESRKPESQKPKGGNGSVDPGFRKLFDAVGYRPLEKRVEALNNPSLRSGLERGTCVPCPMPQHKHADYSDCFGPLQNVPELMHCLGNCGWSGDVVAACYQFDGGAKKYETMYDCARAICKEEGLKYEDFFPPKSAKVPNEAREPKWTKASCELEFHIPAVEARTHRDYVIAPAVGEQDGWFPLGGVSLVGGPSGASKTTWMLQLLIDQRIRISVHRHETYGRPFLMLGADRGEAAHKRTMDRMNLSLASVPFKPLPLAWDLAAAQAIVDQIEATVPLPEIVFVEGVDMLVTDVNNIKAVSFFAHALQKIAQHFHTALIGSLGSPKVKEGHGYTATRDNLLGSGGWGRTAETVAVLQYPKNDDTTGRRNLTVVLRNAPPEKFPLRFRNGRLEIDADNHEGDKGEAGQASRDIEWYQEKAQQATDDPTKKWWTILDMERALNMSHATADRHVKHDKTKRHLVQKPGGRHGRGSAALFCWNESKTNPLWVVQKEPETADAAVEAF
jgi:Bifunctional DNA primase/polymerase, N-terminal